MMHSGEGGTAVPPGVSVATSTSRIDATANARATRVCYAPAATFLTPSTSLPISSAVV
jgi:hypothetical protein